MRQRAVQAGHQRVVCLGLLAQGLRPGIRYLVGSGVELRGQALQMRIGRLPKLLVQGLRVQRHTRHRAFDHRLQAVTGNARTGRQAVVQRLGHRAGQVGIGPFHVGMELGLARQHLLVHQLVSAVNLPHDGLQCLHHIRQRLGLHLHGLVGLVALVRQRKWLEIGGHACIQFTHHSQTLAPTHGRHHAQQRRRGHPGHRRTERQTQTLDGLSQRRANGGQIG